MLRSLLPLVAIAGCSGSAGDSDMAIDLGIADLSIAPDQAIQPVLTGTQLATGTFAIADVTADDYVIVYDPAQTRPAQAIPSAGGATATLEAGAIPPFVKGKVVFSYRAVGTAPVGILSTWTAGGGLHAIAPSSPVPSAVVPHTSQRIAAASADGSHVLYLDNSTDGSRADVLVAKSDGSASTRVLSQVPVSGASSCPPQLSTAGGLFVIGYCPLPGDAGTVAFTVATVDPAAAMPTARVVSTDASLFVASKDGSQLVLIDSMNQLLAASLPFTGLTRIVDTGVTDVTLSSDGATAVYVTLNGALKRSPTQLPAPANLIGVNVAGFAGQSPDLKYVALYNTTDPMTNYTDLFLASTQTAGAPTTLTATATSATGGGYGDTFTRDSTRVMWLDGVGSDTTGTLHTAPVAGGAPATFSTGVWSMLAAQGSKIVFNDRYALVSGAGFADVKSVDGSGGTPQVIVTQADADIFVSADGSKVLFTASNQPIASKNGLYATAVP